MNYSYGIVFNKQVLKREISWLLNVFETIRCVVLCWGSVGILLFYKKLIRDTNLLYWTAEHSGFIKHTVII